MPYIEGKNRAALEFQPPFSAGTLNYKISRLVSIYLGFVGLSYQNLHDVVGVLRDVATEIERRFMAPYEDRKLAENGEVFQEIVDALKTKREA